jgi:hypothetical protein
MNYLQPSEYELYGLETTTALSWVTVASAVIDAHCRRATLAVAQYTERLRIDSGQRPVRLNYLPLSALPPATTPIISLQARYAMPRRGEMEYEAPGWDAALAFGLPGTWVDLDVSDVDVFLDTGEVTLPVNLLGWRFTELQIVYTAGLDPFPDLVKVACAQVVKNAQATPALNVKRNVMPDKMQLMYFSASLVDDTVQSLLAPYVAQKAG